MYGHAVTVPTDPLSNDKARRREPRELVATYHRQELRSLIERVREGLAQLDAGNIDEFELDDLIHRYKQVAGDLWKFCGVTGTQVLQASNAIAFQRERGEQIDWWAKRAPRDRRIGSSDDESASRV